ncbi:hypothetical protein Glove_640g26 [Diversispora epigaea]|uniref:Uncharacterized protein n=1 Tax=Diversispora epigaea TaxID=1348612 RepID=A0A397G5W2_9GLOM|nr:hypothetical protein Glove_640g26 [Diversispora epigaea]
MKLIGRRKNPEAKKQLRSILKEIDFIHLHFDESDGELIEIARGLPEASSSNSTKRKRNSGGDGGNKKSKRQ